MPALSLDLTMLTLDRLGSVAVLVLDVLAFRRARVAKAKTAEDESLLGKEQKADTRYLPVWADETFVPESTAHSADNRPTRTD